MNYEKMWTELKSSMNHVESINRSELLIKMMGIEVNESRKESKSISKKTRAERDRESCPF